MNNQHPHNIDVERALLGAILIDHSAMDKVTSLRPEDFFYHEHGEIFAIIRRIIAEGRTITPLTISPFIGSMSLPDGVSPALYLGRLVAEATTTSNAFDYSVTIREYAARRTLIAIGDMIGQSAKDMSSAPSALAVTAVDALDSVISSTRVVENTRASIGVAAKSAIAQFKAGIRKGVTTGLFDLDNALGGGLHKSELSVFGARPSMGKSALAVDIAMGAAKGGNGVMFFSLEMDRQMVSARAISSAAWLMNDPIEYESIRNWNLDDWRQRRVEKASDEFSKLPLVIDDEFGLNMTEIAARCRQQADRFKRAGHSLDLVIIDHIGKVKASDRYAGNKVHETGEKTNAMLGMAKDMDIAVMALHQLSRSVEGRDDKRPTLPDLRDSGNIEEDAHTVGFIYRPVYYLERTKFDNAEKEEIRLDMVQHTKNILEVSIAKNRNGPCSTVELFVDIGANAIRNKLTRPR